MSENDINSVKYCIIIGNKRAGYLPHLSIGRIITGELVYFIYIKLICEISELYITAKVYL